MSGLCGRNVAVHTERGTWVEEQILGGRASDVPGLLYLKGLQGHPGVFCIRVCDGLYICGLHKGASSRAEDGSVGGFPTCNSTTPFL